MQFDQLFRNAEVIYEFILLRIIEPFFLKQNRQKKMSNLFSEKPLPAMSLDELKKQAESTRNFNRFWNGFTIVMIVAILITTFKMGYSSSNFMFLGAISSLDIFTNDKLKKLRAEINLRDKGQA